ncbi:MAG: SDR family oxidoreductase [Gemmatimonadetes bacterium]|nr:SDR family oxidoreductase [Gemmatimonadota bacterium]
MSYGQPGPQATSASAIPQLLPAFLLGAAFAITAAAGSALLLYATRGFLRATGLLIAVAIGALTAGVWVSGVGTARTRARWVWTLLAYASAALAVQLWSMVPGVRGWAAANSLALLLMLALPAYATGLLAGGFRIAGGTGIAALGGGAVGVLLATGMLIPRYPPPLVFAGTAGLVLLALLADWQRAATAGGAMPGPVAIVTGVGSRGQLGYAIAARLAAAGWRVLITGRSEAVHQLAAELAGAGRAVGGTRADLLDEAQARSVVAAALDRYGRIDGLVNVAGGLTLVRPVADTHLEELQRELDRNLATALVMSRAALPARRASRGAIVSFASPAAAQPVAQLAAYSAAKAGVVAFTGALAREEQAAGVRVNAVAPGVVDTEQNLAEGGAGGAHVSRAAGESRNATTSATAARGISGETICVLEPSGE